MLSAMQRTCVVLVVGWLGWQTLVWWRDTGPTTPKMKKNEPEFSKVQALSSKAQDTKLKPKL